MNDFFSRLSSYNIFNYLLPGALFVFAVRQLGGVEITAANVVVEAFVYYFIGMTISRVGSVLIEPACQYVKLVNYASYKDYITACESDDTISILLEQNNVYRTVIALVISVVIVLGVLWGAKAAGVPGWLLGVALAVVLLALYGAAYRKQTSYIKKRVEAAKKSAVG